MEMFSATLTSSIKVITALGTGTAIVDTLHFRIQANNIHENIGASGMEIPKGSMTNEDTNPQVRKLVLTNNSPNYKNYMFTSFHLPFCPVFNCCMSLH